MRERTEQLSGGRVIQAERRAWVKAKSKEGSVARAREGGRRVTMRPEIGELARQLCWAS